MWLTLVLVASTADAGIRLYDNTGNPANVYYSAQGGAEAIDDVHCAARGALDSLVLEYIDPATGGTFSATVTLYANPGGLDLGTPALAGPFVVHGLPRGRGIVSIPLGQLSVEADLWVGVQFSSTTAGLVIHSVPAIGHSHDVYLENGGFYWFGGEPKANFGLRLVGSAASVAVGDAHSPGVRLLPVLPNPFGAATTIRYALDQRAAVRLEVLDVTGRRVRMLVDRVVDRGTHAERWSGQDDGGRAVKAGVYFVRLETSTRVMSQRVVLAP